MTPDQRVIAATKRQPEYGKPVGAYVNDIASRGRIANGQRKAKEWAKTFDAVEKKFGVERWVLLALWGIETDFGAEKDHWDVFRSLATLGYVGYRHPYFRNELIVAMRIMQDDHFARDKMVSSWAGAMGQTQFMPSNVVDYAIDFSGDGKSDIWTNVPDVLGSTGNYLAKEHWKHGLPWGFEVTVPKGFDYMKSRGSFTEWAKLGVRRADGKPFPPAGQGILFFPSGANGPAFIATENYAVLKEYNNSDPYAIAVGHLADRMNGGPPIKAAWPADDHPISRDARIALQKKLVRARLQGARLRRPHRLRPARQYPRRTGQARHAAGRKSDSGVSRTAGRAGPLTSARRHFGNGGSRSRLRAGPFRAGNRAYRGRFASPGWRVPPTRSPHNWLPPCGSRVRLKRLDWPCRQKYTGP